MEPPVHDATEFLRRIGYDPRREDLALLQLERGDRTAARKWLLALSGALEPSDRPREARTTTQLLIGLLQRVLAALPEADPSDPAFQRRRLDLIQRFDGCRSFAIARQRFDEEVFRLLPDGDATEAAGGSAVERARRFIRAHSHERISLSDVAAALGVSPGYLSRSFRERTGRTLTEAIQRERLRQARRLLGDDRSSLAEIAYRVGYQNYRDFYRNFVKYENAAPREVRRSLRTRVPRVS